MQIGDKRGIARTREVELERAEGLAIEALSFIARDEEALARFMSLSGIDVASLRAAAAEPGFLAGVLDHLAADETLLLSFAANAGRDPADVARARRTLSPEAE